MREGRHVVNAEAQNERFRKRSAGSVLPRSPGCCFRGDNPCLGLVPDVASSTPTPRALARRFGDFECCQEQEQIRE